MEIDQGCGISAIRERMADHTLVRRGEERNMDYSLRTKSLSFQEGVFMLLLQTGPHPDPH